MLMPLAAAGAAQAAGLIWAQEAAEVVAEPAKPDVVVDFHFRNAGPRRIAILAVTTGCDCTTAHADRLFYEPGEAGRVEVVFHVGDFLGLHEEVVHVRTDEPGADPQQLLLRVHIPQDLVIEPRILVWRTGSPATEKIITCAALPGRKIVVSRVEADNPGVSAWVETIEPGLKYHVHVKLRDTSAPVAAAIRLEVTVNGAPAAPLRAYLSVARF